MSGAGPRRDDDLPLFEHPGTPGPAGWPEPELAVVVAASTRPLRLDGARATALGTVRGPLDEIRFASVRAVTGATWGDGAVANAVVAPGLLRRERVGRSSSWEERVLVAPGLPLVVLTGEPGRAGEASLSLTAFPGVAAPRYRTGGGSVTLRGADPADLLVLAAGPSCAWRVDPDPSGGALLRCSSDDGVRSVVIAYGTAAAVRGALGAARHLAGHAVRAGAGPDGDLLTLGTGAYGLDHAVAWMERRLGAGIDSALAGAAGAGPASDPDAWLWAGLGATAVGDPERARRCAAVLDGLGHPGAAAFLQARAALSDGRTDGLLAAAERCLTAPDTGDRALRRLALRSAADALRYAASEEAVARVAAAGRAPDRVEPASGGRRLPTVGGRPEAGGSGAPPETVGAWLSRVLEGPSEESGSGVPDGDRAHVGRALRSWRAMLSSVDGWSAWRACVAEGLDSGAPGVGCWDPIDPDAPPAATGILLAAMAFGWLGAFPDAPVGRLTLRPRIPERVRGYRFEGVAIGDVRLDLGYARDGSVHRFDLEPRRGRVPPLVVLETTVPGTTARVTIDGAPAELDPVPGRAGVTVRLQTPLDAPRRIEIEAE